MSILVCSLITKTPQTIPGGGGYHLLRFPYGGEESSDAENMHAAAQPDGVTSEFDDDRSALIWPAAEGWGVLTAMIQWEPGTYTELRDRFVRDPLAMTSDPVNTTATDHRPPSPGMQCFTKTHQMFVHPDVPLAVMVAHNDRVPRDVVLAEFKLAIHTDSESC